ncbi:MAG: hypothetical protein HWE34_07110 [Methylocystaceae bacterium]|nr:hypothetical protein [Methylocystaceae bacterium]
MTKDWYDNWTDEDLKALSEWDQKLIVAARKGEWLESGITEDVKKPVLTPRLIVSLATGQHNQDWTLHPEGLQISGFFVPEKLNLEGRVVLNGIYMIDCIFLKGINCNRSHLQTLYLRYSTVNGLFELIDCHISKDLDLREATLYADEENIDCLQGDLLRVGGGIFLSEGFHAYGAIRLLNSDIFGNFDLNSAHIESGYGASYSVHANGIKVNGNVVCNNGFRANSTIFLNAANITGQLDFSAADLHGAEENDTCLYCDGLLLGGDIFMVENFQSHGSISFIGANIGGNLELNTAQLKGCNEYGVSLDCEKTYVKGNVFMQKGFNAFSDIDFSSARIDGNLTIFQAHINGDFLASNLKVENSIIFAQNTFGEMSYVDLRHAQTDVLEDDLASWQNLEVMNINGFQYNRLDRENREKTLLQWLKLLPKGQYSPQPYEQLAQVLKNDGFLDQAKSLLIEKEKHLFKIGELGTMQRIWMWISGLIMAYGYRPIQVMPYIIFILILGENVFHQGYNHGYIVPSNARVAIEMAKNSKNLKQVMPSYTKFIPFIYSVDSFIPFVDLDQEKNWMPHGQKTGFGSLIRAYRWFHILCGWVLSSLLVTALAGLVKKDN